MFEEIQKDEHKIFFEMVRLYFYDNINQMKLGELKKIPLRDIWKHEEYDFTTWLAKCENLALLSEEIGIEISNAETEVGVGSFEADILATENGTDRIIIIENQLEATNHDHLGKLITYASGKDAEIIIWIVKDVRDEHKKAIDWLNEHLDEKINFFVIKMELWQIGDSLPAPKFYIVSKPNEWAKIAKKPKAELTDRKLKLLDYWDALREYLENKKSTVKLRKSRAQHWSDVAIGTTKAHISLTALASEKRVGCELHISGDKELYYALEKYKKEIEEAVGTELSWQELKGKKRSRIYLSRDNFDLYDENTWLDSFKWLEDMTIKFKEVFCPYISKN